jgi:hypothetical protein
MEATVVKINEADKEVIASYMEDLNRYTTSQQTQKERFDHSQLMVQRLYETTARIYKLGLDSDEVVTCRNAEILTHFLHEAREANEQMGLDANILQSMREALSLFLADTYNIDMSIEWKVDVEQGVLFYEP